jgi:hypothetical protein
MNSLDPYGLNYGDWEDPYDHDSCTGCTTCHPWEGRLYEDIRADRKAEVHRRRAAEGGPAAPSDAAREDTAYWTELYEHND